MAVAAGRPPRTRFVCASCGAHSPRWEGRCPECEEWNSLSEELLPRAHKKELAAAPAAVTLLADAPADGRRLPTGYAEVDRVLGGGIVPGSVILLGGDPGVGKSTLALQIADRAARAGAAALYCSGEESGARRPPSSCSSRPTWTRFWPPSKRGDRRWPSSTPCRRCTTARPREAPGALRRCARPWPAWSR